MHDQDLWPPWPYLIQISYQLVHDNFFFYSNTETFLLQNKLYYNVSQGAENGCKWARKTFSFFSPFSMQEDWKVFFKKIKISFFHSCKKQGRRRWMEVLYVTRWKLGGRCWWIFQRWEQKEMSWKQFIFYNNFHNWQQTRECRWCGNWAVSFEY